MTAAGTLPLPALPAQAAPETELLLCLAMADPGAARRARAAALLEGPLDWARLLRAAFRHRLAPVLHHNLAALSPESVPGVVRDGLRAHFHAGARRNFRLAGELAAVVRACQARGIPLVALKGPALAAEVHGTLNLRAFADLDLLAAADDAAAVARVLAERGYRAAPAGGSAAWFVHPAHGAPIELHTSLGTPLHPFRLPAADVVARPHRVDLLGAPVPTLPPAENLVYLAYHGTRHLWARLGWLTGFAELARTHAAVDLAGVHARAEALGCGRSLRLAILLSHRLLGQPLPPALAARIAADACAARMASQILPALLGEGTAPGGSTPDAPALLAMVGEWMGDAPARASGIPRPTEKAALREPRFPHRLRVLYHLRGRDGLWDRVRCALAYPALVLGPALRRRARGWAAARRRG